MSFLGAQNFYGTDVLPFAVEIAKVTMVIARKLAIDELHISERALPLANLDRNFLAGDALLTADAGRTVWPEADAIIGNPPFAGAKLLKPERGAGYVKALRRAYPEVPGMADYCVYWLRKAHDHLPPCTHADPVAGRAGLVGTQNIRNNKSRVGGLDHVVEDGTIVEAVDNQPWSGEANVNVSIVNWVKTQEKALLPQKRRLWFKVDPAGKERHKREKGAAAKEYQLDVRECDFINSALSDQMDVSAAKLLSYADAVPVVCQGITPGHDGFVLTASERRRLIWADPGSERVIFPYLIGRELLNGNGTPDHYLIDFGQVSILDAQEATAAVGHVRETVLPDIQRRADEEDASESAHKDQLDRWWQHWRARRELIAAVARLRRYLVCSRVTKRPIFTFVASAVRPGDALQVFALEDDYSFGILQSHTHWLWFTTKCSKLAERFRYTPESVFDTFPWPQAPTTTQVETVVIAGRELRRVRAEALRKLKGGLRSLYRTLELPGENPLKDAHAALDAAVLHAYGFSAQKDSLTQLLALNLTVAARLEKGDPVSAPGVPKNYPNAASLVSDDCVEPREGTAPNPIPLASVPIVKYGNTDAKGKRRR